MDREDIVDVDVSNSEENKAAAEPAKETHNKGKAEERIQSDVDDGLNQALRGLGDVVGGLGKAARNINPQDAVDGFRSLANQLPSDLPGTVAQAADGAVALAKGAGTQAMDAAAKAKKAAEDIDPAEVFEDLIYKAVQIPGARIDRREYLSAEFSKHYSAETLVAAIDDSPARAGIGLETVNKLAEDAIHSEAMQVTATSAVAGIPGGLAMLGTVPADLLQYYVHVLRIAQKLAYLYGWPTMFEPNQRDIDDGTMNELILFIGVMSGTGEANKGVTALSTTVARAAVQQIPKKALTKGTIYPIVKKVAQSLGVHMTKQTFGEGIGKMVPVVGGVVSGGITYATFLPMAERLRKHLSTLEIADPAFYNVDVVPAVITIEKPAEGLKIVEAPSEAEEEADPERSVEETEDRRNSQG